MNPLTRSAIAALLPLVLLAGCATSTTAVPQADRPSEAPAPPPAPPTQAPPSQPEPVPSPVSPLPNWTPQPLPQPRPGRPVGTPVNVPAGVPIPHCGDLGPIVTTSRWDPALGSRHLLLGIVNCSDRPLTLTEPPVLRVIDSTGATRRLTLDPTMQQPIKPLTVPPRGKAWLHITYRAGGSADAWEEWAHTMSFEVPGVAYAQLTDHMDLGPDSPVRVEGWGATPADVGMGG